VNAIAFLAHSEEGVYGTSSAVSSGYSVSEALFGYSASEVSSGYSAIVQIVSVDYQSPDLRVLVVFFV
jgi:hypothetical protein